MKYAYSFSEIVEAERRAIGSGETVLSLMERAGSALAAEVRAAMELTGADECLFVVGGGNNGGDGWTAARILHEDGIQVAVLTLSSSFSEAAQLEKARYRGEVLGRIPKRKYPLIVDCLFGTGLSRPLTEDALALIDFINGSGAYVIACDLPSGLREGGLADRAVRADETLTMGGLKEALLLADGADLAGKIFVADIGIFFGKGTEVYEREDLAAFFPRRRSHSHKGSYGTVGIVAGYGSLGAPILAASAALKSGAGYTKLFLPPERYPSEGALYEAAVRLPVCILSELDFEEVKRCDALAFGMGALVCEKTAELLFRLLEEYRGKLLLDADALNVLARRGEVSRLKTAAAEVIATPHPAEFSRLTGKSVGELLADPVGTARRFAEEYGIAVVFKNNRSVISDGVRAAINLTGSPVLAKGGSGDALSGLLAGTMARGLKPYEAAVASCYLLGKAGELAAREEGEYSPDASDIISRIGRCIAELLPKEA